MRDIFTKIYHENGWKDSESVSGKGSNLRNTEVIRETLVPLLEELGVKSVLDIPCGDYYWMNTIPGLTKIRYIGADIVPELIEWDRERYEVLGEREFEVLDATTDWLPKMDLILCRDMLGHFDNVNVMRALKNFRASGSKYLLATTFPGRNPNSNINTGEWRPIDLEALRYGLGPATLLINEASTEGDGKFSDKSLGLWEL